MADVDEVIRLLEEWRDATGVGRVAVAVDATRTIRGLSPAAKRELAAEVAERVAPQLVPQIRGEEGDLTGEQVAAVVDLLRRADRDQLDDLVTALRTGDVDASLALVDEAVDTVAPAVPDAATAAVEDRVAAADERVDELLDEAIAALEDHPPAPPEHDDEGVGPLPAIDEAAVRAAAEEAAAVRAERWRDTSAARDRQPYVPPAVHFDITFDELDLPDPTVVEVAPLEERRHDLPGVADDDQPPAPPTSARHPLPARGHHVGSHAGSRRPPLAAPPTPAVVAAVTATPDGYRRRRAALAAIRASRLSPDDVAPVVDSFARVTDRSWVAGAALDAGLLDAGGLDALDLPDRARRRLEARRRA